MLDTHTPFTVCFEYVFHLTHFLAHRVVRIHVDVRVVPFPNVGVRLALCFQLTRLLLQEERYSHGRRTAESGRRRDE